MSDLFKLAIFKQIHEHFIFTILVKKVNVMKRGKFASLYDPFSL